MWTTCRPPEWTKRSHDKSPLNSVYNKCMLLLCEGDSPFKMIHLLWIIWLMLLTWKKAYSLFTQTIFKTYWIFTFYDVKQGRSLFSPVFFLTKKEFPLLHEVSAKSLQNVDYFTFQVPQYFIFFCFYEQFLVWIQISFFVFNGFISDGSNWLQYLWIRERELFV